MRLLLAVLIAVGMLGLFTQVAEPTRGVPAYVHRAGCTQLLSPLHRVRTVTTRPTEMVLSACFGSSGDTSVHLVVFTPAFWQSRADASLLSPPPADAATLRSAGARALIAVAHGRVVARLQVANALASVTAPTRATATVMTQKLARALQRDLDS